MEYGGYGVEAKWTNMAVHRYSYMKLDGRSCLSISGLRSADGPVGEASKNRPLPPVNAVRRRYSALVDTLCV